MSGRGPKPCMDLDFTHIIKTSGITLKITCVCAVVTGRYCKLKMKEMELREQELALQLKLKKLEITAASTIPPVPCS